MTSQEAYVSFLNLANKLNSNDDVNIDIGRFVLLYNKHAKIWLTSNVKKDKATRKVDELQGLIKENILLTRVNTTFNHVDFQLPDDWYDFIGGYALCTRGTCKDRVIYSDQAKNEEKSLILFDANWRPDFDFEWLPVTIGEDKLQVFFSDFSIQEYYLDYYRYPVDIDIAGYVRIDGTASVDTNPDLADAFVNEIIDLVVADVSRIYQNNEKAQLDINRIQQEQ